MWLLLIASIIVTSSTPSSASYFSLPAMQLVFQPPFCSLFLSTHSSSIPFAWHQPLLQSVLCAFLLTYHFYSFRCNQPAFFQLFSTCFILFGSFYFFASGDLGVSSELEVRSHLLAGCASLWWFFFLHAVMETYSILAWRYTSFSWGRGVSLPLSSRCPFLLKESAPPHAGFFFSCWSLLRPLHSPAPAFSYVAISRIPHLVATSKSANLSITSL